MTARLGVVAIALAAFGLACSQRSEVAPIDRALLRNGAANNLVLEIDLRDDSEPKAELYIHIQQGAFTSSDVRSVAIPFPSQNPVLDADILATWASFPKCCTVV